MSEPDEPDENDARHGRGGPVAALVVIILLVAAGLGLAHVLRGTASLQDCMMSGRSNCAPVGRS